MISTSYLIGAQRNLPIQLFNVVICASFLVKSHPPSPHSLYKYILSTLALIPNLPFNGDIRFTFARLLHYFHAVLNPLQKLGAGDQAPLKLNTGQVHLTGGQILG